MDLSSNFPFLGEGARVFYALSEQMLRTGDEIGPISIDRGVCLRE